MSYRSRSRDSRRRSSILSFLLRGCHRSNHFSHQHASISSGTRNSFIPVPSTFTLLQSTRSSGTTFGLSFNHRCVSNDSEDGIMKRTPGSWMGLWETLGIMVPRNFTLFPHYPMTAPLGLRLAKLADLPVDVLDEAARVTELMEEQHSLSKTSSEAGRIAQRRKLLLQVNDHLPLPLWSPLWRSP
jgi:hypothetical protein